MNRPVAVIDWPQLLADMQHLLGEDVEGHRVPAGTRFMAAYLGYSRGVVRNWVDGSTPNHHEGEHLIERWMVLTGKARVFVPMTRAIYSAARA